MFSWVHGLQVESKNRSKIDKKSMPRCLPIFHSVFDRFLIVFGCQLGSIFPSKFQQNPSKIRSQEAFKNGSIFESIFRGTKKTKVAPRRRPKRQDGPKKRPKTAPRGSQKTDPAPLVFGFGRQEASRPPPDRFLFDFNANMPRFFL